jgi:uncharacterized protein (TIGR00255 family)
MTGFGVGDAPLGEGRVVAEARSVNQRFLDVRARLPREMADLTMLAEQTARERLRRGRVELVLHAEGAVLPRATLDRARARSAMLELATLRDELAPSAELPLSLLTAVPDLFTLPAGDAIETTREAVQRAVERALEAMGVMCEREGAALATDLGARAKNVRALVNEVRVAAERGKEALRRRAKDRIERAIGSSSAGEIGLDATRLEAEIVLLVERGDASEELARLESHLDQLETALPDPTPVGRRLDFLLQEMTREANTLGAKAQDASVAQLVVTMKVELERLREQAQNVE